MYEDFLCERLGKLRTQKGVSARDMSLSIGQSESYINVIENRKSLPSMTAFFYICEYLGVTPKEFFDEGIEHPKLLGELMEEIRPLDGAVLRHLLGLIQEMKK